jgi:hypothetical protein
MNEPNQPSNVEAQAVKSSDSVSTWWKRYRIVRDNYAGYEVQCWRFWFPVWIQCNLTNTHSTIEAARRHAVRHSRRESWKV